MFKRIISLNGDQWRLGSVAQKPFGDVNDLDDVSEWLPAQIPGDVRLDLLRAGKIANPFFADNNEQSQWVDAHDWWYVRRIESESESELELKEGERAFLIFEGIDYQSAVWVNGKQLGRHAGMFSRQVYEITDDRRQTADDRQHPQFATRNSQLAVRIWGSDALPKMKLSRRQRIWKQIIKPVLPDSSGPYPDRYATLKCQMQFGWDFAPRLRTCGIWDDVSVVVARSVFVGDAWIKAKVKSQNEKTADIQVILSLDSDREQAARVVMTARGKNFQAEPQAFAFDLQLERGRQTREIFFDLLAPRLWNPWDRGEPNLYELEIEIRSESVQPLDSVTETFGIRAFEFAREAFVVSDRFASLTVNSAERSRVTEDGTPQNPLRAALQTRGDGEPWTFILNGAREFGRGANWVPLDAIPGRLTRADYETRLRQARDANINFLRVWGGGLKEKRAFYDLCDEFGILVWQEFPFAGAILDRFPSDRAFLKFVDAECSAIVRALRNHPSLVVWCGGNEFNTRGNRAIVNALREAVAREDGTRPFKPASPYRDESHNWYVWHGLANLRDYKKDRTPFLSEFGLQAAPSVESLKKFLPANALFPPNALWEYHHAESRKLFRYTSSLLTRRSAHGSLRNPNSEIRNSEILDFVSATQRAQAHALQIAIEHLRRRKDKAAGVAMWQLNDPWPNISWSIIDYYGVPKLAYHKLRQLYAPVLASFDYALTPRRAGDVVRGELWLVNDLLRAFPELELGAYHNGKEIYARRVDVGADSAARIDSLAISLGQGENILRLFMRDGAQVISENTYDLDFCDVGEISSFARLFTWVVNRVMK